MKIIQLIYSLSSGGGEKFAVDLSNQLAAMGHDVTVCMLMRDEEDWNFNKQFLKPGVKFHSMGFDRGWTLRKCRCLEKYIRGGQPDVVQCHFVIHYLYTFAFKYNGITFFDTLHTLAPYTVKVRLQYYLNHFFYQYGYIRPVCISRLCRESYEEFYKLHNAPCINNGRAAVPVSDRYDDVRNEVNAYKRNKATPVFIHVARFAEVKNQQLLVDAFNRLEKENTDFTLLVIGNGFDCEEGRQLQRSACSNIHFLGEKNNVNDYLHCSDAFCLTSRYEGLPISLLEALSCGVVPVCTPAGGIPDVVKDGKYGYLSSGQTVDSYCEAIRRFLKTPIPRQTLIGYYNANYSIEVCAEKHEALYKTCIKRN